MRQARSLRLLAFVLLLMLGLGTLPMSPVAAANCANIAPGANLAGCDLSGMDLSGVNLAGANLRGADLTGANLDGANLSGANLSNVRITEGALDAANTSGANLRGIEWIAATVLVLANNFLADGSNYYDVAGSGYLPNAPMTFSYLTNNGSTNTYPGLFFSDTNGSFYVRTGWPCDGSVGTEAVVTVSDGTNSASFTMPILC
jgi:hypothetical protein